MKTEILGNREKGRLEELARQAIEDPLFKEVFEGKEDSSYEFEFPLYKKFTHEVDSHISQIKLSFIYDYVVRDYHYKKTFYRLSDHRQYQTFANEVCNHVNNVNGRPLVLDLRGHEFLDFMTKQPCWDFSQIVCPEIYQYGTIYMFMTIEENNLFFDFNTKHLIKEFSHPVLNRISEYKGRIIVGGRDLRTYYDFETEKVVKKLDRDAHGDIFHVNRKYMFFADDGMTVCDFETGKELGKFPTKIYTEANYIDGKVVVLAKDNRTFYEIKPKPRKV